MKRKAEPATVEEEEEEEVSRPGGSSKKPRQSASITASPDQVERRRKWRKSDLDFQSGSASKSLGLMLDVITQAKEGEMLTILAGEHADNPCVWKQCQKLGRQYRTFYPVDNVINGEYAVYIDRNILISKEDLDRQNPDITIAQRTYSTNGEIELQAHKLLFEGHIDLDRPYIFPKLGDEIPGIGYPDLHCTFRSIRDWSTVAKTASFASCDRNISIEITSTDVQRGRKIVFDFESDTVLSPEAKSTLGVEISCADFKPLYESVEGSEKQPSSIYPKPTSKEKNVETIEPILRNVGIRFIGMGPVVEGTLRADLNMNLVLKS